MRLLELQLLVLLAACHAARGEFYTDREEMEEDLARQNIRTSQSFREAVKYVDSLKTTVQFHDFKVFEEGVPGSQHQTMDALLPLKVTPKDFERANPIQVGSKVSQGPDWSLDLPSSPTTGSVIGKVSAKKDTWVVEWEDGSRSEHRYGDGVYELAVLPPSPLDTVTAFGSVTRVKWHPEADKPFAEQVALVDEPLIIENTIATQWRASQLWTPSFFNATGAILEGVKKTPKKPGHQNTPFFYYHSAPMNGKDADAIKYKARAYERANLTVGDFLALAENSSETAYTFASKLDAFPTQQDGRNIVEDVFPLHPFMVVQPGFDPKNEHLYRQTHLWISPKGSVTPAHFDLFHNFYVQLYGRKRFLLFPPSAWQYLYPYPLLHPAGRSAQVDLNNGSVDTSLFPQHKKEYARAIQADLGPGDVLYIPPLWFHHVTAVEMSISVSVWSPHVAIEIAARAAEDIPLPIKRAWPRSKQIAALRLFVNSLIGSLHLEDMNMAEFLHWTLLDNRYKNIGALSTPIGSDRGPFCYNEELTQEVLLDGESIVRAQVKKVLDIFKDVRA